MFNIQRIAQTVNFTIGETHTIAHLNALQRDLTKAVRTQVNSEIKIAKQNVKDVKKLLDSIIKSALDQIHPKPKRTAKPKAKKVQQVPAEIVLEEAPAEIVLEEAPAEIVLEEAPAETEQQKLYAKAFDSLDEMNLCETPKSLSKVYKQAVLFAHPDKGGDSLVFRVIQDHYDNLVKKFENSVSEVSTIILAIEEAPEAQPEKIKDVISETKAVFEVLSTECSTETEFICEEAPEVQEDDFWAKCAQGAIIDEIAEESPKMSTEDQMSMDEIYAECVQRAKMVDEAIEKEQWEQKLRDLGCIIDYMFEHDLITQEQWDYMCEKHLELRSGAITLEEYYSINNKTLTPEQLNKYAKISNGEEVQDEDEDFEDVSQDFQVKSRRSVKISSVGLSAKAKKSLKVQTIKSLNKQK